MGIDWNITVGNIIEITSILGGGVLVLNSLKNTVINLKNDVGEMQNEIKKIGDVLTNMAVANVRIDNLEQDVRDLKSRCNRLHETRID